MSDKKQIDKDVKMETGIEGFEWTPETEVQLFYALKGHKPVGVNRYFQMICVQELFNNLVSKEIPSKVIWEHLDRMYDMEALHENEDLPFPNNETDFTLPSEFQNLMAKRINIKVDDDSNESSVTSTDNNSNSNTSNSTTVNQDKETVTKETSSETIKTETPVSKEKKLVRNIKGKKTPLTRNDTSTNSANEQTSTPSNKQTPASSSSQKKK